MEPSEWFRPAMTLRQIDWTTSDWEYASGVSGVADRLGNVGPS
jgi:hypothetical protein